LTSADFEKAKAYKDIIERHMRALLKQPILVRLNADAGNLAAAQPPIAGEEGMVKALNRFTCSGCFAGLPIVCSNENGDLFHRSDEESMCVSKTDRILPIIRAYLTERVASEVAAAVEQCARVCEAREPACKVKRTCHHADAIEIRHLANITPIPYAKLVEREVAKARLEGIASVREYAKQQWAEAEAAIVKVKAPFKYRASKEERQATYTKGASCAYEDILHHIAELERTAKGDGE